MLNKKAIFYNNKVNNNTRYNTKLFNNTVRWFTFVWCFSYSGEPATFSTRCVGFTEFYTIFRYQIQLCQRQKVLVWVWMLSDVYLCVCVTALYLLLWYDFRNMKNCDAYCIVNTVQCASVKILPSSLLEQWR